MEKTQEIKKNNNNIEHKYTIVLKISLQKWRKK